MLCKIADLYVEVPEAGGMAPRLTGYLAHEEATPDIVIREERYSLDRWPGLAPKHLPYMDSGWMFYSKLMLHGGMMLHSSAVELDGRAYLFSGPSGIGKSTHTKLWQELYPSARIFNDDKPALRENDGVWYAYGTPWCGKNGINQNIKAPLAGICFLKQGSENSIRQLSQIEAASAIMTQTLWKFYTKEGLGVLTEIIDRLVRSVPVYLLVNKPEPEAARLSYTTMSGN